MNFDSNSQTNSMQMTHNRQNNMHQILIKIIYHSQFINLTDDGRRQHQNLHRCGTQQLPAMMHYSCVWWQAARGWVRLHSQQQLVFTAIRNFTFICGCCSLFGWVPQYLDCQLHLSLFGKYCLRPVDCLYYISPQFNGRCSSDTRRHTGQSKCQHPETSASSSKSSTIQGHASEWYVKGGR